MFEAIFQDIEADVYENRVRRIVEVVSASGHDPRLLVPLVATSAIDETAFVEALTFCVGRDLRNPIALRALCWHQKRAGQIDAARACLLNLIALAPDSEELKRELLRFEMVAPSANASDHIALGFRALHDDFTHASYSYQLGLVHRNLARPDSGAKLLSQMAAEAGKALLSSFDRETGGENHASDAWWDILRLLMRARSIALVGNGSSLRGAGFGEAIDGHDVVVRFNFPKLAGFAADVGCRTDLIAFSEALIERLPPLLDREPSFRTIPLLSVFPNPRLKSQAEHEKLTLLGFLPDLFRSALCRFSYREPTSGALLLYLLVLLRKNNVSVFGFDFYRPHTEAHYFDGHHQVFLGHDTAYERFMLEHVIAGLSAA